MKKGRVYVWLGLGNEWRWTLHSANGRVIGSASEGYKKRSAAIKNFHDVTGRLIVPTASERRGTIRRELFMG